MAEWFQAGYFTMSLLVKRGCDEVFQPLGEIIKIWGRVPFTPGPAPPPLQVRVGQVFLFLKKILKGWLFYFQQSLAIPNMASRLYDRPP